MNKNTRSQQGFVLVVSLVFLIALTGVASALMLNTTSDMKMSGASQEKVIATQEALGAIDEAMMKQMALGSANNFINFVYTPEGTNVAVTSIPAESSTAVITNPLNNNLTVDCSHSEGGSDVDNIDCTFLRLTVTKGYGNKVGNEFTSTIVINAGIEQQVFGQGAR